MWAKGPKDGKEKEKGECVFKCMYGCRRGLWPGFQAFGKASEVKQSPIGRYM